MIQGQCVFCSNYLILNDKLECCNSADGTPDERGRAFKFTKGDRIYVICPVCYQIKAEAGRFVKVKY